MTIFTSDIQFTQDELTPEVKALAAHLDIDVSINPRKQFIADTAGLSEDDADDVLFAAEEAKDEFAVEVERVRDLIDSQDTMPGPYGYGVGFDFEGEEYAVMDDGDADSAWNESLDSYIDECILPELPEMARRYFDSDKFKSDARDDGRGHSLASYDGAEYEEQVDGEYYYIYRTN